MMELHRALADIARKPESLEGEWLEQQETLEAIA
jgi:hypothetical protein